MSDSPLPAQAPPPSRSNRWAIGLLAATAGLLLLACLSPCIGVGLLGAIRRNRERDAAREADAAPHETGRADPRRPYPVGLRNFTFTYRPADSPARERKVVLWYPTTGEVQPHDYTGLKGFATPDGPLAPGRHPVILFSHGYRGAAVQTIFLMEAFAREGYVVAAIDHADSLLEKQDKPTDLSIFFDPASWTDARFRDRHDDLVALLDRLFEVDGDKNSYLHEHINHEAIGAAGHSLGGYTVGGMIGGWPTWRDRRIRAALLLSPYTMPFDKNFGSMDVPVMLQGGTADWGITPLLQPTYDGLLGPKHYLILQDANHFEWTNFIQKGSTTTELVQHGNARLMTNYGIAFFNHHLLGEDAPLLRQQAAGLHKYQFQANDRR